MNNTLVETIRSRGHWRINYQPVMVKPLPSLEQCEQVIIKNKLSLTGWDFPHIPYGNNESENTLRAGDYVEANTDLRARKEYWRMYKSSQFIYYKALREDWLDSDAWYDSLSKEIKIGQALFTVSTIYDVTQSVILLSRLIQSGLYEKGVRLSISLRQTYQRELWIDDSRRIPFFNKKKTAAHQIEYTQQHEASDITANFLSIANHILLTLFDSFGWNPPSDQIMVDQIAMSEGRSR